MNIKKMWSSTSILTKLIAVLCVVLFVSINVVEHGPYITQQDGGSIFWYANFRGWPIQYFQVGDAHKSLSYTHALHNNFPPDKLMTSQFKELSWAWHLYATNPWIRTRIPIFINIIVAIFFTILICAFFEWLVRRRRHRLQGLEPVPLNIGLHVKNSVCNIFDNKKIFFMSVLISSSIFNLPFIFVGDNWIHIWLLLSFPLSFVTLDLFGNLDLPIYVRAIIIGIVNAIMHGYLITNIIVWRRKRRSINKPMSDENEVETESSS